MGLITSSELRYIEMKVDEIECQVDALWPGDARLYCLAEELATFSILLGQSYKKIRRLEIGFSLVTGQPDRK